MTKKSQEQLRKLGRFALGEVFIIPSFDAFLIEINDEPKTEENVENVSVHGAEPLLTDLTVMG